jgi:Amt family ammonium transporter
MVLDHAAPTKASAVRRPRISRLPVTILLACALLAATGRSARAAHPSAMAAASSPTPISRIDSGDTAWMLISAALVLMMTGPGLALFYSGLVRRKNVLATMMQSFVLMALVSVIWSIVGYSLAFDHGTFFIGGFKYAFLNHVGADPNLAYAPTIPHTTWMVYQLMFAIITPALICGAYAERMKFSAMLLFSTLWLLVIYCPMAHMVWGDGGLFNWQSRGSISLPALDYAGGTVVHISSGVSALVCALVLGKRRGYGKIPMPPHSVVLSVIGAALLWVGWFGFNAGSALQCHDGSASGAFIATHFAAAAATLSWMFIEWLKTGKPTVLGAISGAVAGLVVITPASGFVGPMSALVMGAIAGMVCFFGATVLKHLFHYDDSLDAFGVHGVGGTIGAILTGVFASSTINSSLKAAGVTGLIDGNPKQLLLQLTATAVTWIFAAVGSFVLLKIVDATLGLRVTESDEYDGLDLSQHGESGYNFEEVFPGTVLDEEDAESARNRRAAVHAAHA